MDASQMKIKFQNDLRHVIAGLVYSIFSKSFFSQGLDLK